MLPGRRLEQLGQVEGVRRPSALKPLLEILKRPFVLDSLKLCEAQLVTSQRTSVYKFSALKVGAPRTYGGALKVGTLVEQIGVKLW